jgi:small GTP-binding protein
MPEEIIKAIVYTLLDERIGPQPHLWYPIDLKDDIRMSVGIKSITLLSTDHGVMPKSLVIIPFPNLNLKGVIKYIERPDESYRGGISLSSITLLFNEADDLIFYKYIDYLESAFSESAQAIIKLENEQVEAEKIFAEINKLRKNITEILTDLHNKEKNLSELEAFPEEIELKRDIEGYNFKVIACGDPGVGKTSTILQFTDNAFMRTYIPTLGVSISEKVISVKNYKINLILWDIAGQSKFEVMRRHFYQGTEAVILIFDLTNRKSFDSVPNWFQDLRKNVSPFKERLTGFILGNKEDLIEKREVSNEEALNVANELGLGYIETSALTGKNVEESFIKLSKALLEFRKKI